MNILDIFKRKKPQEHQEYRGISTGDYALYNQISSYKDASALSLSAVYRCVQVISDAVAQLPIEVYKTDEHGHKREYKDSPVYRLMQRPSETMTKFTMFKTLISYVLLRGNGYIYIKRSNGQPVELVLIDPSYVTPVLENNKIIYNITGYKLPVSSKDIIHIINHSEDGYIGISTLTHARKSLQLASDSESHAAGFFRGGANSAGILKIQGIVTNDQKEKIRSAWQLAFNAQNGTPNGVAVLDGNMDYQPITVNPTDAQLLETRKFNVIDICRFFGVSPIKAFDLDAANYSTVEATQLAFLTDTLAPLLQKIEEEFNRKLFDDLNAGINFDENALLRADKTSQADYYTKLINAGIITPSEARRELGYNYREESDKLFMQTNMSSMDNIANSNTIITQKKDEQNGTPAGTDGITVNTI